MRETLTRPGLERQRTGREEPGEPATNDVDVLHEDDDLVDGHVSIGALLANWTTSAGSDER